MTSFTFCERSDFRFNCRVPKKIAWRRTINKKRYWTGADSQTIEIVCVSFLNKVVLRFCTMLFHFTYWNILFFTLIIAHSDPFLNTNHFSNQTGAPLHHSCHLESHALPLPPRLSYICWEAVASHACHEIRLTCLIWMMWNRTGRQSYQGWGNKAERRKRQKQRWPREEILEGLGQTKKKRISPTQEWGSTRMSSLWLLWSPAVV